MTRVIKNYTFSFVLLLLAVVSLCYTIPTHAKYMQSSPVVIVGQGYFGEVMQTQLYISYVSDEYISANGTSMTYGASANETITVTITNPTDKTYYYSNLSSSQTTISATPVDGTPYVEVNYTENGQIKQRRVYYVDAGQKITFTVIFTKVDEYSLSFNFTVTPPKSDELGVMTNATFVAGQVLEIQNYGLNEEVGNNVGFINWCNQSKPILYSTTNKISGGTLSDLLSEANASGLYFTLEWVSNVQYNLYMYPSVDSYTSGTNVIVYKQILYRETVDSLWIAGGSYKGYAELEAQKHAGTDYYHIRVEDNKVLWSAGDIPNT